MFPLLGSTSTSLHLKSPLACPARDRNKGINDGVGLMPTWVIASSSVKTASSSSCVRTPPSISSICCSSQKKKTKAAFL